MDRLTDINDFNYNLPQEKIALFPCPKRDESKLLVYQNHQIQESRFKHVAQFLNSGHILVFNNTKVVQARLIFHKPEGASIEIFCLEPVSPTTLHALAFEVKGSCRWLCYIGNNKRLKGSIEQHLNTRGRIAH